jgi:hypothetical protein
MELGCGLSKWNGPYFLLRVLVIFFLLTVCPRARTMEQKIIPDLHRGIDGDSQIAQNRMRM